MLNTIFHVCWHINANNVFPLNLGKIPVYGYTLRNHLVRTSKLFSNIWEGFDNLRPFHEHFCLNIFYWSIFRFCAFLGVTEMQQGMTWPRHCRWLTWLHLFRTAGTDAGLLRAHGPGHCSYRGGMAGQVQVDVDLLVLPKVAGLSVCRRHRKRCHWQ